MTGTPASARPWDTFLARLTPARRGALIYVVAGLVFVATDSLTKSLVSNVPVVHVVFGRHVAYLLGMLAIAGRRHPLRLVATQHPWTQVARGLASFSTTALFFLSLSLLPMAEVSTLSATAPLIVVGLAGPLLGERITRFAIGGALIGFAGVVTLIGIDPSQLDPTMLVPLGSAFSFALFSLLTRGLHTESADVTVFCSGLVGLAASIVLELIVATPRMPEAWEWGAIGVVGLAALTGHRMLVAAYRWGRASDMAPLGYLSIVWSFLVGTFVFGEPLQARAVVGASAIAAGGLMTLRGAPPDEELPPAAVDYGGPVQPES